MDNGIIDDIRELVLLGVQASSQIYERLLAACLWSMLKYVIPHELRIVRNKVTNINLALHRTMSCSTSCQTVEAAGERWGNTSFMRYNLCLETYYKDDMYIAGKVMHLSV